MRKKSLIMGSSLGSKYSNKTRRERLMGNQVMKEKRSLSIAPSISLNLMENLKILNRYKDNQSTTNVSLKASKIRRDSFSPHSAELSRRFSNGNVSAGGNTVAVGTGSQINMAQLDHISEEEDNQERQKQKSKPKENRIENMPSSILNFQFSKSQLSNLGSISQEVSPNGMKQAPEVRIGPKIEEAKSIKASPVQVPRRLSNLNSYSFSQINSKVIPKISQVLGSQGTGIDRASNNESSILNIDETGKMNLFENKRFSIDSQPFDGTFDHIGGESQLVQLPLNLPKPEAPSLAAAPVALPYKQESHPGAENLKTIFELENVNEDLFEDQ
mmetsp:Transcript_3275/g.5433  ORF Transcript_3275/g.5433 Transcript_3275/m.5433 type:complete len:329 (+) Transcript_3275:1522-2508(+)